MKLDGHTVEKVERKHTLATPTCIRCGHGPVTLWLVDARLELCGHCALDVVINSGPQIATMTCSCDWEGVLEDLYMGHHCPACGKTLIVPV